MTAVGGRIEHVDVTLICEQPRIGPHRAAMTARVAELLGLRPDRVSVKATTTEHLGFTGRGEGIAAQAVATVRLPDTARETALAEQQARARPTDPGNSARHLVRLGLSAGVPGSCASLTALPCAALLVWFGGPRAGARGRAALFLIGIWAADAYMEAVQVHDPRQS